MAPYDLTTALDAIDVMTKATALHLSQDVAFQTVQFIMSVLLQVGSPGQHQNVQDPTPPDATGFDEAQFIKLMERLTHAFVSDDLKTFHRTLLALETQLSQHNLFVLSSRLSEIVQLWSSEKPKMERKDRTQKQAVTADRRPAASAFASQTAAPTRTRYGVHQKPQDAEPAQQVDEEHTTTEEDKGKGKMPMTSISGFSSSSSSYRYLANSDIEVEPLTESLTSSTFLNDCQRVANSSKTNSRLLTDTYGSSSRRQQQQDSEQQPNDSNDWSVDKAADGVLVGRPPEFPPGLLDWDDSDKGKKVADVAPDNLTRAKTAAASTFRAAQGALQGLIGGGVGGSVGGSTSKKGEEEGKNNKKRRNKNKKKEKKGRFVKTGQEQEKHVHRYSDFYDSEDGSDWVTL